MNGERPSTAARACGVSDDTMATWMSTSPDFAYGVNKAAADAQATLERAVYKAAQVDPRVALEELKRRDPLQHNEKVAVAAAEETLRRQRLPDPGSAIAKAEKARSERLAAWKQDAHLIEAGAEVVPIASARTNKKSPDV